MRWRRRPSDGIGYLMLVFGLTSGMALVFLWSVTRLIARDLSAS